MKIDDDLKARIKDLPCSQVIGLYLPVVQKSRSKACRCPFHDDNDPSLMINDDKGMWRCWVDDIGGDAIGFVQRYLNVNFPEALEDICRKLGWNFDDYLKKDKKADPKYDMAKKLLTKTTQLYRKIATATNCAPYEEFLKKRGISPEHAELFGLGFAPGNNVLFSYLDSIRDQSERAFALKIALEIGLIKQGERNQYDTFRNRIVFPIWDQFGQVIGFTARTIDDSKGPKYLNSSESFIFNKSNLLYGFHLAKNAMRERGALLVEGNMDQLSLFTKGFENSIAIQGVALGEQSLKRLITVTKNIYLGLDNDQAGRIAQKRIQEQFLHEGILTKTVSFAPHKDADDFLSAEGRLALQKRIDEAPITLDLLLSELVPEEIPTLTDRKIEILEQGFALVAPLKMSLAATERLVSLAKSLGLGADSGQIGKSYEDFLKHEKAPAPRAPAPETRSLAGAEVPTPHKVVLPKPGVSKTERFILQEIVQHPELLTYDKTLELLDFCESDGVKNYISRLKDEFYEISDSGYETLIRDVMNTEEFPLEIREAAMAGLFKYRVTELDRKMVERMLFDLNKNLQIKKCEQEILEIKEKHKNVNSEEESQQLMARLNEIQRKRDQIKRLKPNTRET